MRCSKTVACALSQVLRDSKSDVCALSQVLSLGHSHNGTSQINDLSCAAKAAREICKKGRNIPEEFLGISLFYAHKTNHRCVPSEGLRIFQINFWNLSMAFFYGFALNSNFKPQVLIHKCKVSHICKNGWKNFRVLQNSGVRPPSSAKFWPSQVLGQARIWLVLNLF
jgi:hypothetical protein